MSSMKKNVLAVALVAGLGFGLAPALRSPAADVNSALKSSGRGTTGVAGKAFVDDDGVHSPSSSACGNPP